MTDPEGFIRTQTALVAPPLCPELVLHLATEATPLWEATEAFLEESGLPPPYWAFAWPGGQATARHLLDAPDLVRGLRVLDLGAGSGIGAIAAARAGAASVVAADIDPLSVRAIRMNAAANGVVVEATTDDLVGGDPTAFDLVLAGDVCYERPMAGRVTAWLRAIAASGRTVLLADPGRTYLPSDGLVGLARYTVPTSLELEDREERETVIWRVAVGAPGG